jgi:predicted DNA-binding transcriptional regulator YafY
MNRTERFYKIELLLRSRGCVGFDTLLDDLAVSPATLKRDLQYLRGRMGAPIVYDRDANGYRFEAAPANTASRPNGVAKTVQHELPGLWFSERELHALLTMHQLLAGLDDDGVLSRHLQPMMEKLQSLLGVDVSEARELMRRVKVIGTARRRVPSRHFELLGSALVQRKRVWLRYFKRVDRVTSEREVSPQRLVNYRNTWYLDAWCHASDGLRRFALDAVRDAKVLDSKAKNVALRDLEAELDAGYGIYGGSGAKVMWATLVFDSGAAQWVANEEWHPQQKARWLDAPNDPAADGQTRSGARSGADSAARTGRYELKVPYSDPTELAMDILRHGDSVEVVGDKRDDKRLAALVKGQLGRALARYE